VDLDVASADLAFDNAPFCLLAFLAVRANGWRVFPLFVDNVFFAAFFAVFRNPFCHCVLYLIFALKRIKLRFHFSRNFSIIATNAAMEMFIYIVFVTIALIEF
jgi:hypothetical protein